MARGRCWRRLRDDADSAGGAMVLSRLSLATPRATVPTSPASASLSPSRRLSHFGHARSATPSLERMGRSFAGCGRLPPVTRVALCALLLGCGSSVSDSRVRTTTSQEATVATSSESSEELAADTEGSADTEDTADEEEVEAAPVECAERSMAECTPEAGCVPERNGTWTCRAVANECERIELELPSGSRTPLFDGGDPCQRKNPACAWSMAAGLCEPFTAVESCPATAEEAARLQVFCEHSDQSALSCSYPGTECACRRAIRCGGAPPPPEVRYAPAVFSCVPDFAPNGCPNRPPPRNARCNLDPSVQCQLGCRWLYTCQRGRWRSRELPPRP